MSGWQNGPQQQPPQQQQNQQAFNNVFDFDVVDDGIPGQQVVMPFDTGAQPTADETMMSLFNGDMLSTLADDMAMNIDSISNGALDQMFAPTALDNTIPVAPAPPLGDVHVAANVPGGGPAPADGPPQVTAASQAAVSASNGLTEFTKRRNWPAKVVEELRDFLQILDASGRIKYTSRSITEVAGYDAEDVREIFLKDLLHPDDQGLFVAELNESIASGNPLRLFYRLRKKDGAYTIFEAVGHAHVAAAKFAPNPSNQSPFCQAVFMMARPYPTKNASLLDSFLEHKIENERLKRRISELRREEEHDAYEASRQRTMSSSARSDGSASELGGSSTTSFKTTGFGLPSHSNVPGSLTRENLEGSSNVVRQDSLRDKMARFEGPSHGDTIEMLTGLRYAEGERSHGITTGNTSPSLVTGDAGIAMPKDPDGRAAEKKKRRLKAVDEYVCTDCGLLALFFIAF